MYERILLPVDGSGVAEQAIHHAVEIAKGIGSEVIVLRVVTPIIMAMEPDVAAATNIGLLYEAEEAAATAYNDRLVENLKLQGITARSIVKTGDVADTVFNVVDSEGVGLIVMATHGRSGIRRWALGSVADRVVRGANVPVLLVRAVEK